MKTNALFQVAVFLLFAGLAVASSCNSASSTFITAGANNNGQLLNGFQSCSVPFFIQSQASVVSASFSSNLSYFVDSQGDVFQGTSGSLTKIDSLSNIVSVSAGPNFALALDANGNVFQIYQNDINQISLPAPASQIAVGDLFALVLLTNGEVFSGGDNSYGQLGTNVQSSFTSPLSMNLVALPSTASGIAAGLSHSLFMLKNGQVYSSGNGAEGQLGLGNFNNVYSPQKIITSIKNKQISQVAAGSYSSYFLTVDGRVYSCGLNANGQLGLGDNNNRNVPIVIGGLVGKNIIDIEAGNAQGYFISNIGTIFAVGDNEFGSLANGTFDDSSSPVTSTIATGYSVCSIFSGSSSSTVGLVVSA